MISFNIILKEMVLDIDGRFERVSLFITITKYMFLAEIKYIPTSTVTNRRSSNFISINMYSPE